MRADRAEFKAAGRDVRRQALGEIGVAERLRRSARRMRHADYSYLGIGTSVVLMTVIGVGSAACRQVPVTVSCTPAKRRVIARHSRRTRWRNLRTIQQEAAQWPGK